MRTGDSRIWHEPDMPTALSDVRFWAPENICSPRVFPGPLAAIRQCDFHTLIVLRSY